MIATCSENPKNLQESLSTLRFAENVAKIVNFVKINRVKIDEKDNKNNKNYRIREEDMKKMINEQLRSEYDSQ